MEPPPVAGYNDGVEPVLSSRTENETIIPLANRAPVRVLERGTRAEVLQVDARFVFLYVPVIVMLQRAVLWPKSTG